MKPSDRIAEIRKERQTASDDHYWRDWVMATLQYLDEEQEAKNNCGHHEWINFPKLNIFQCFKCFQVIENESEQKVKYE